ncbi:predicted protein [Histoplasma capsulatum G186AR]|uniref:Uncharacterized protein n=1 Tax=Ajellomyces capsulatus (strain G186AR / H82 / ATCC MYA-2454 / RMSCC 2432) TaxID=447093 RepID=C0P0S1_AJECG|nr:uncharacterized protein HCBG_09001 [Histoplasma capsulatum G186AR]EEH02721.1 predicted protein [Histoplasma capsulatum G186AR]
MACIFQSLPPKVLERRFGAITSWPFSGVCLNVVPPIYQRLGLAPTTRQEFKLRSSAALIIPSRGVSLLFQRPLSSIKLWLLRNGHGEIVRNGSKLSELFQFVAAITNVLEFPHGFTRLAEFMLPFFAGTAGS